MRNDFLAGSVADSIVPLFNGWEESVGGGGAIPVSPARVRAKRALTGPISSERNTPASTTGVMIEV